MIGNWLRRRRPTRTHRVAPHAEWLEPRLLYSADAGALLAATNSDDDAVETRTLDASFEYTAQATATPTTAEIQAAYALTPLQFEINQGQLEEGVDFAAFGSGYRIELDDGAAEISLGTTGDKVRLELVGAQPADAVAENQSVTRTNYILGDDASQWITGIANYGSVLYEDVYQGIDVRYYGNQGHLEYDFIVHAGADASQIALRFDGVDAVEITSEGDLLLRVAGSGREVRFAAPFSYQQGENGRETVESRYELQADGSVRIVVGAYDATRELVVDPVLRYATYFGDTGGDLPTAVAVGADGSVYITGYTNSTGGTTLGNTSGGLDLFVARHSADLHTAPIYVTRMGSNGLDRGNGIAVDAAGNAYVAGTASSGFPVSATTGHVIDKATIGGTDDAVLIKLDSAGVVQFSTYVGGTGGNDTGNGVVLGSDGRIYVAGTIANGSDQQAALWVFAADGDLLETRQFGGSNNENGAAVALDAAGNVYLVGTARSDLNLDVAKYGTAATPSRQGPDGFLVRYDASGALNWWTYIGGSNGDSATGVAVDNNGRVFVVGSTNSPGGGGGGSGFATTTGALSTARYTNNASYFRIYNTSVTGTASLEYSTFIGGSNDEVATGVAVIGGTRAVIVGTTDSTDLPTTTDAVRTTNSTTSGFAMVIDTALAGSAQLAYGTYFATGATMGGVAVSGNTFYFTGSTTQSTGLIPPPAPAPALEQTPYDATYSSNEDGFIAAIGGFSYNTAPTLTGANNLPSVAEDTIGGSGALVSSLVNATDPDAGTQLGIAITVADSANGTWEYSLNGTTWTAFTTPAAGSALLLAGDATTRVRFVPAANFNGTASLTFHAWDGTAGAAGTTRALGVFNSNGPFSSATGTSTVTVTPVNDLPVATAANATGAEDAASIAITLTSSDLEDTTITGVKLTSLPAGGVLYTDASLQTEALVNTFYAGSSRTFWFVPTADFNGSATFGFKAVDAASAESATAATATITVTPANDAPVLTAASNLPAQLEDAAADGGVLVASLFTSSDIDASASSGIAITAVAAGGSWQYTLDGTNWVTFTSPASGSALLLAADGTTRIRFTPAANFTGTSGITYRAWDRTSGAAGSEVVVGGTGGTSAFSDATATSFVTVTPVNDAPVLAGANNFAAQLEDAAAGNGTLVADLVMGQVSDPDAGAQAGIAVTAVDTASGSWQYSLDGTTWLALTTPAAGSALLLDADATTRVRFLPNANYAGTGSTITFRAWDRTAGTAGTVVTVGATGDATAFSTATHAASAVVTPVNDRPVFTGTLPVFVSVAEGATVSLGLSTLGYAPGGGADEAGQTYSARITGLPTLHGSIQLADGTAVVLGNVYTLAELQGMRVVGAGNISGFGTFSFDILDSGGTANGGEDAIAQSLLVVVTNAAPMLLGSNAFTQLEDVPGTGTLVSAILAGQVTDAGGAYGLAVTNLPNGASNNGVWQYSLDDGATWSNMVVSNNSSLLLGPTARVRFLGDAGENVNGTPTGFTFRAWDGSSGASGGTVNIGNNTGNATPFSQQSTLALLSITPVNDIPVRYDFVNNTLQAAPAPITVNEGTATAVSLGLANLGYIPGYALDEYQDQVLAYTVLSVPSALGTVYLQDGTTVVTAGTSYTLAQIQTMRFRPGAGVQSGTGALTWQVKDNAGTANGGVDTLVDSVTINVRNIAPVLNGFNAIPPINEDLPGNGIRVDDLVTGKITDPAGRYGIAVTAAPSTAGGTWEYTSDGGSTWNSLAAASNSNAILLTNGGQWRVRFNPAADWSGTPTGFTFRAWDRSTGTAGGTADLTPAGSTGGFTAFSTQSLTATVVVNAVNDAPTRADAPGVAFAPLVLLDGSPITALGLAGATFDAGPGAAEDGQSIVSYTVTGLPSALGKVFLANGSTEVVAGNTYTLAQIQGMQFLSAGVGQLGTGFFTFAVKDNGGTANGGVDTATFSVKVVVNRAPVLYGANSPLTVFEDFDWTSSPPTGNPPPWASAAQRAGVLVDDIVAGQIFDTTGSDGGIAIIGTSGSGTWQYSIDGSAWTTITGVSNSSALQLAADGTTRLRFLPSTDWNSTMGTAGITFRAWDQTVGTAGTMADATWNGGPFAFSAATATSVITVGARNDAPLATGLAGGTVEEGAAAPAQMLVAGAFAPGPATATDEAAQTLTFRFTAISTNVQIFLADGVTAVTTTGSYSLAQFQGMVFRSAANALPGASVVSFSVQDSGGVANGGIDTSTHNLTLTITNKAPLLLGANPMTGIQEDTPDNGTLVSDLVAGQISDPSGRRGIAVTAVDNTNGTWQYSLNGGSTWQAFGTPSGTSARLLLADANTRVRFVPTTDWNGTAALTFAAWDGSSGTAGNVGNATVNGGATAFSTTTATTTITVSAVNDPPVGGLVTNLTVAEDSGSTSLALGAVSYTPGSHANESGQALAFFVTALPDAALGRITLADGTSVAVGQYTIEQLRGMRFVTAANGTGTTSFTFAVRDDAGGSDTLLQTITITVTPVNDAPGANPDSVTVVEDTPTTILAGTLTGNDTDIEGDPLTITGVANGTGGTVALSGGNVVFTPTPNYFGPASFSYTVSDGKGGTASVTVNVTITNTNDAPVAANDSLTATSALPLTITPAMLLGNDTDIDGDTLSIVSVAATPNTHGSVTINGAGNVVYTSNLLYLGAASFTYTVRDPSGATSTATVNLNVVLGTPPVAGADTLAATEDTPKTIDTSVLLQNDSDPDAILFDNLRITSVSAVTGGTVSLSGTTITFTPAANFNGEARFTYVLDDGAGLTSIGTVTLIVAPANDAPVAVDDAVTANEDEPLVLTPAMLVGNDTDLDGDTLTILSVASGSNGTVALDGNGNVVFTGAANFHGTATFTYVVRDAAGLTDTGTVTVTVNPTNDAPVASDDAVVVTEDQPLAISPATLLGNDTDIDLDTLTVTGVTQGAHGSVTIAANGDIVYAPTANFHGSDTFTYTVSDGKGGTATATVSVTVNPANDAPVAADDTFSVREDTPLVLTPAMLLGNDTDLDLDTLTIDQLTAGADGTVGFDADGNVVFTPRANFAGTTTFSYRVTDGNGGTATATVTVTVLPENDAPVAVADSVAGIEDTPLVLTPAMLLGNDTDADGDTLGIVGTTHGAHGTVTLSGTDLVYTPDADYFGTDTFTYTVSDGNGGTATQTVTVTVAPRNDAPVARTEVLNAVEDQPLTVDAATLTANDFDQEGEALTVTNVFSAIGGTVTLSGTSIVFQPLADFNGTASFMYTVRDASGATSTATVTVEVAPANDAPVPVTESFTTEEDTPILIAPSVLLGNDTDLEGDTLRVLSVADDVGGSVNLTPAGIEFTPSADFNGTASFWYTVTDDNGGVATVRVTVTVTPVNDGPTLGADVFDTLEDTPLTIDPATLLLNDTDAEGEAIGFAGVSNAQGGSVAIVAGKIVFTPTANFAGMASFDYTATDVHGVATTGTVRIQVNAQPDAPLSLGSGATVVEGGFVDGTLTAMDPDEGDVLTFELVSGPANGSVVVNSDGTYRYTHDGGESVADVFTFKVTDASGASSQSSVTIVVTPVNDAPVANGQAVSVAEGGTLGGNVTGSDAEGSALTYTLVGNASNGTVTIGADGSYTYVHDGSETLADSFVFEVRDAQGATSQATVSIGVTAVNDAPVGNPASVSVAEGGTLNGNVTGSDAEGGALTYTLVSGASNGSVTVGADGSYTYVHNGSETLADGFVFEVRDAQGATSQATVTIAVTPVNDAPVADPASATVAEGGTLSGNVTGSDAEGSVLTYTLVSGPSNGTVTIGANGSYTYVHNGSETLADSFVFEVRDAQGATSQATVTIGVTAVNDAPVANPATASVAEGGTLNGNVTGSDAEGGALTFTLVSGASNGTVTIGADGSYTYVHNGGETLADSFVFEVRDAQGATSQATVTIGVTAVNDAPVANPATASVAEGGTLSGSVTGSDAEGSALTYTLVSGPANGSVTIGANGSYTYIHNGSETMADSFVFEVRDSQGATSQATVTIGVSAVNDAPVANPVSVSVLEGGTLSGNVTGSDAEGSALTYTLVGGPSNGTVTIGADGSYTYIHNGSETTGDSFVFEVRDAQGATGQATVTIGVTAVNDAPVANPATASVAEGGTLSGTVTGSDAEGTALTYTLVSGPANGSVTIGANGSYTYVHNGSETVADSFVFEVRDSQGATSQATVTIGVTAVNDAPVANPATASVAEGGTLNGSVTGSDAEGSALAFTLVSGASNGTVTVAADGSYTYIHNGSETLADSFVFEVRDAQGATSQATVTIGVTAVNDAPVANPATASIAEGGTLSGNVTGSDAEGSALTYTLVSGPANGTVTIGANGSYTYIHDGSETLADSFIFEVRDSQGATSQATVTIGVTAVNDAPVANPATASVAEGGTLNGSVTGSDAEGSALAFTLVSGASNGTVTVAADGSYTYIHNGSETLADSFVFEVRDAQGATSQATVTIGVTAVNDAPVANPATASIAEGGTLSGNVTGSDAEGSALTYTLVSGPANGTVTIGANGSYTYIHDGSETLADSFVFEVRDAQGATSQATVTIGVTPVNDAPVADPASATVAEGGTLSGNVTGSDAEGSALTYTLVSGPSNGTVTIGANGSYTYIHNGSETTGDSFVFEVRDSQGATSQATVSIGVTAVNDAPVANPVSVSVAEGGTLNGAVTGSDAEGSALTYTVVSGPSNGTVTIGANGSYTYVHNGSETVADSFVFEVRDAQGATSQATVTLGVTPVNDAPVANASSATVAEGATLVGSVTGSDAEGSALTYTLVGNASNGTVTIGADGSYTYVHNGSETLADSFVFEVRDAQGATGQATVTIVVTPVNDAPVANAGSVSVAEGGTLAGNATASDAEGSPLTYTLVSGPSNGSVTVGADGSYTYLHDGSETLADSFVFEVRDAQGATSQATVTVAVTPVNDAPVAAAGSATVNEGGTVAGNVTGSDAEGSALTYTLVSGPSNGTVTIGANGSYTYIHDGSETLADGFVFEVRDAQGATSQAKVTIAVTPVNDAPVADGQVVPVAEGGALSGNLTGSDAEGSALAYTLVSGPSNGTVTIGANGSYTYLHDGSETLADSFVFEVRDALGATSQATVSIAVTPVNDAPVANASAVSVNEGATLVGNLTGSDAEGGALAYTLVSGPSNGTVTIGANGSYTYIHDGSETLADSFVFEVRDAQGAASQATVTIAVAAVNDAPVAQAGTAGVDEGGTVSGSVNATDAELDALTYTLVGGPARGTVVLAADGSYTYTHDASETTGDSFTFEVRDVHGATSRATVTIAVRPVNDAPVAGAGAIAVDEGAAFAGNVTATDAEPGTLTYVLVGGPANGTVTLAANGSYTYVHDGGETTADSFTFEVRDAQGATSRATVAITVRPVDDATQAGADSSTVDEDTVATGNVLLNDTDPDSAVSVASFQVAGDSTVYVAGATVTIAGAGTLTLAANGDYRFTPLADLSGTLPVVTYTTSTGVSSTLAVTLRAVEDAPVRMSAPPVDVTVAEGSLATPLGLSGLAYGPGGGLDESGQVLVSTITALPTGVGRILLADGTTEVVQGGSYTLDQLRGMRFLAGREVSSGSGTFSFSVTDGLSTTILTETFTVTVVNEAPILSGANALPAVNEDTTDAAGMLVGDLVAGHVSDPLGNHGIAVVAADSSGGRWEFSRDGGATWTAFTGVSATSAQLLAANDQTRVRFVPNADWNGQDGGLGFRAWDYSGGTAASDRADTTVNGGSSAFSAGLATTSITVVAVDEPLVAPPAPAPAPAPVAAPTPAPAPVADAPAPAPAEGVPPPPVEAFVPAPLPAPAPAPAPATPPRSEILAAVPPAPAPAPTVAASAPGRIAVSTALGEAFAAPEIARDLLPTFGGFSPQYFNLLADVGHTPVLVTARELAVSGLPGQLGDFVVRGFASADNSMGRITVEEFQQALRSGVFIEELNRIRRQLREDFNLDSTTTITVAGLSLGVSIAYVLWLVRGGVLLGSYLSALPAWRLLDPLPVLGRSGQGEQEDDDDEAFEPANRQGPDPLRGFA